MTSKDDIEKKRSSGLKNSQILQSKLQDDADKRVENEKLETKRLSDNGTARAISGSRTTRTKSPKSEIPTTPRDQKEKRNEGGWLLPTSSLSPRPKAKRDVDSTKAVPSETDPASGTTYLAVAKYRALQAQRARSEPYAYSKTGTEKGKTERNAPKWTVKEPEELDDVAELRTGKTPLMKPKTKAAGMTYRGTPAQTKKS